MTKFSLLNLKRWNHDKLWNCSVPFWRRRNFYFGCVNILSTFRRKPFWKELSSSSFFCVSWGEKECSLGQLQSWAYSHTVRVICQRDVVAWLQKMVLHAVGNVVILFRRMMVCMGKCTWAGLWKSLTISLIQVF